MNGLKKKSQLEVLGLTIVIILITLGILFIIKFVILKGPSDLRKEYSRTEMASNMLNSLLRTDTECRGKSVTELLQDCARYPPEGIILCDVQGIQEYSCDFVNKTIKDIFTETFTEWQLDYEFVVYLNDGKLLTHVLEGDCTGEKESKPFYVPLQTTTINLRLDICN